MSNLARGSWAATLAGFPPRWRRLGSAMALGTLAFIVLRPALGILRECLVALFAKLLRDVSESSHWTEVVALLAVDPVYTLSLVNFAGEISVLGVAVAEPFGSLLTRADNTLFLPGSLVAGGWASAIVEPGATVLARGFVGFAADGIMLWIGLVLFMIGLRRRRWLSVCGALQQAHVVFHQFLDLTVSISEFEASGLPFALSALFGDFSQRGATVSPEIARLPDWLLSGGAGAMLALIAYVVALPAAMAVVLAAKAMRALRVPRPNRADKPRLALGWRHVAVGLAVAALGYSPIGAFAESQTRQLQSETQPDTWFDSRTPRYLASPRYAPDAGVHGEPTQVYFEGANFHFKLFVSGEPTVVRGVGYNPQYSRLPTAERIRLYERDFSQMSEAGVNVVFGWFQEEFDELTLDLAHAHAIGVGMPFELNQDLDYTNPDLRRRLSQDMLTWVRRYRDHPAVWFWTPGNEVLHRLVFPAWLRRQTDPRSEANADAFARFYVDLIDQIHAADPSHPVIYRDAEDVYLPRLQKELARDGIPRPWFAYGTNVYSRRLNEILEGWPKQRLDCPLLVAEFSPGGTGPVDRPRGLETMWGAIRSHPEWVIGGVVYTWTTEGPEELDRVFGLVDGAGNPPDGSLATLARLYREDTP